MNCQSCYILNSTYSNKGKVWVYQTLENPEKAGQCCLVSNDMGTASRSIFVASKLMLAASMHFAGHSTLCKIMQSMRRQYSTAQHSTAQQAVLHVLAAACCVQMIDEGQGCMCAAHMLKVTTCEGDSYM